jgi:ABC-type nickel/cobalt efflux system permease component RcnA
VSCVAAIAALLLLAPLVHAHPVPANNHDRYLLVRLTPTAVVVDYRLEVDETRAGLDLPPSELARVGPGSDWRQLFCKYFGDVFANNLTAELDGKPLEFACVSAKYTLRDDQNRPLGHLRCEFRMQANWTASAGADHKFTFREGNYLLEDFSRLQPQLVATESLSLEAVTAPDAALLARSPGDFRPGDAERLRNLTATFRLVPATPHAANKPALPPDFSDVKSEPEEPAAATKLATPGEYSLAEAKLNPPNDDDSPSPGETADPGSLLHLLLNTKQGIVVLLLGAAAFGAAHALTPGHGKTLVAAYLVGERGTVWHALLLGIVTTVTHTAAVILIAIALLFFPQTNLATVHTILECIGGVLVLSLGLWLLYARLTGQADHLHLGGGHHHRHGHDHSHHHHHVAITPPTTDQPSTWALVLLGFKGGMVPCWDAVFLLTVAVAKGLVWLALPLLLAFSAGLAAVLTAVGIAVVHASRFAGHRLKGSGRFQGVVKALPLISATAITLVGLWLCYDAVHPR